MIYNKINKTNNDFTIFGEIDGRLATTNVHKSSFGIGYVSGSLQLFNELIETFSLKEGKEYFFY